MRTSSVDGRELPSPRVISTAISETKKFIDYGKTQAMSVWGLFISHDMAHTAASNMGKIFSLPPVDVKSDESSVCFGCRYFIKLILFS